MRKRTVKRAATWSSLAFALVVVLALATRRVALVTTRGVSMLPHFHTGDLAVLHTAASYHVGEIVTYWSPVLHTTVMHRIHSFANGLYTFKGDNNPFIDPVHLPASSIRGALWFHIPKVGSLLSWAESPLHAGVLALFVGSLALYGNAKRVPSRGVKPRGTFEVDPEAMVNRPTTTLSGLRSGVGAVVAGSLAIALFLAFTVLAFESAPAPHQTPSVQYGENLDFSYAAFTTPNAAYPTGSVTSPAPVYLKLVPNLDLSATYAMRSTSTAKIGGTIALSAAITKSDGWSRVVAAIAPRAFSGNSATAAITLPLAAAAALSQNEASATGVDSGDGSLVVTAKLTVHGTIGGRSFSDTMAPVLAFQMNPLEVALLPGANGTSGPTYPQLDATHSGTLRSAVSEPSMFHILGLSLNPEATRVGGLLGLVLAIALTAGAGYRIARRRNEDERTLRRLQGELVALRSDPSATMDKVVEVATITAMANLADRLDVDLFEFVNGVEHLYSAIVGDILYRCRRVVAAPVEGADFLDVCIAGSMLGEASSTPLASLADGIDGIDVPGPFTDAPPAELDQAEVPVAEVPVAEVAVAEVPITRAAGGPGIPGADPPIHLALVIDPEEPSELDLAEVLDFPDPIPAEAEQPLTTGRGNEKSQRVTGKDLERVFGADDLVEVVR